MPFKSLGLSEEILRAVQEKGYKEPFPIQAEAIPAVLTGRDVIAAAQTGTGKTAAFTLPLLNKFSENHEQKGKPHIRALIMTPTRELADQIQENIKSYSTYLKLNSTAIFGGMRMGPQISKLRRGVDLLVATPGRLLDFQRQKVVNLSKVEVLVLDEADRMLDMGFIDDIRQIIDSMPEKRQTLLFSATFSKEIRRLTDQLLTNPIIVEVEASKPTPETLTQEIFKVDNHRKAELLNHLIVEGEWKQVLVFTRTKIGADNLCRELKEFEITASAIHSDKSQFVRSKTLTRFKAGKIQILVATDIAARGLDIKQLPHVVNYEIPNAPEDYVHRIGRTGRAGVKGHAISLVSHGEMRHLKKIEHLLGMRLTMNTVPGFESKGGSAKSSGKFQSRNPRSGRSRDDYSRPQGRSSRSDSSSRGFSKHGDSPKRGSFSSRRESSHGEGRKFAHRDDSPQRGKFSPRKESSHGEGRGFSHREDSPKRGNFSSRSDSSSDRKPSRREESDRGNRYAPRKESTYSKKPRGEDSREKVYGGQTEDKRYTPREVKSKVRFKGSKGKSHSSNPVKSSEGKFKKSENLL